MKREYMGFLWAFMIFASNGYSTSAGDTKSASISLERSDEICYQGLLKGFSVLAFSAQFPATKEVADKVNVLVKDALASFGKVVPSTLIVKTKEGEAIDFSNANEQGFLTYTISDLTSLDGKKQGLLKATLTLEASVEIVKTKSKCVTEIWSQSCFLQGSTEEGIENAISDSLRYLLQGFLKDYLLVNKEKPIFDLYQS